MKNKPETITVKDLLKRCHNARLSADDLKSRLNSLYTDLQMTESRISRIFSMPREISASKLKKLAKGIPYYSLGMNRPTPENRIIIKDYIQLKQHLKELQILIRYYKLERQKTLIRASNYLMAFRAMSEIVKSFDVDIQDFSVVIEYTNKERNAFKVFYRDEQDTLVRL